MKSGKQMFREKSFAHQFDVPFLSNLRMVVNFSIAFHIPSIHHLPCTKGEIFNLPADDNLLSDASHFTITCLFATLLRFARGPARYRCFFSTSTHGFVISIKHQPFIKSTEECNSVVASDYVSKIFKSYHINFWVFNIPKNGIMMVIRHNIACIGLDSAIHKFVVIWICCDQIPMIIWRNILDKCTLCKSVEDKFCGDGTSKPIKDLSIFFQDFIRNTQNVLSSEYRIPNRAIWALFWNTLNKTVGVKDYSHLFLFCFVFTCFLLPKPLMEIHFIDFVKTFLVENPCVPKRIHVCVQLFGVIVGKHFLHFQQFCFRIVTFKHFKQEELNRIKHSSVILHSTFIINSAKIQKKYI